MGAKNWSEVTHMYAEANILGIPRRERYSSATRWFDGNVLYEHNKAIARLEKTLDKDWLLLREPETYVWVPALHKPDVHWENAHGSGSRPASVDDLLLESICVGGMWHGGKLKGKPLHLAVHKQYLVELDSHFDDARRTQANRMSVNPWIRKHLFDSFDTTVKNYQTYRMKLAPYLPDLPNRRPDLEAYVNAKVAKYEDPKSIIQRERNAARKEARKAFDMEEDKKNKRV